MTNTLDKLREDIDRIDGQLLDLLNQRAKHALHVGELKKANDRQPIRDDEREQHIQNRLKTLNQGPLNDQQILECFNLFIKQSRDLQESL